MIMGFPPDHSAAVRSTTTAANPGRLPGLPDKCRTGNGNTISSATGLPTIVVPVGFNIDGVGDGLEFLGRSFDEATVIRLAYAFEQAAPHRQLPASTPLLGSEQLSY